MTRELRWQPVFTGKYLMSQLLFMLLLTLWISPANADTDLMSPEVIQARIQPVGKVYIAGDATPPPSLTQSQTATLTDSNDTGEKIYQKYCSVCHANGIAGAPKFSDTAAWKLHAAKGLPTLLNHVEHGFNAMPPKGTCIECTNEDLKSAIIYMLKQAQLPPGS